MIKNNKVLILGSGWLGLPLGQFLSKKGNEVFATTTSQEKFESIQSSGLHPILFNSNLEHEPFKELVFKQVIITLTPSALADEENKIRKSLSELLPKLNANRFVMTSSTGLYPNTQGVFEEVDAIHHTSRHFHRDVLAIEKQIQQLIPTINTIRFGGLYGPCRNPARFVQRMDEIKACESPVNLIHLDDCIGVINHVLEANHKGEVVNAVASQHPTRKEFYTHALRSMDKTLPRFTSTGSVNRVISNKKLINELGYQFKYDNPIMAL